MAEPVHEMPGERLVAYLFDELPAAERQAVEAHLAACPRCRRELAWHRWTLAALARWPAAEPSPELDARVLAAAQPLLAARRRDAAARRWHARHWWVPVLGLPLAFATLLLAGMLLLAPLLAPLPARLGWLGAPAVATLGGVPLLIELALSGLLVAVLGSAATCLPLGRTDRGAAGAA